MTRSAIVFGGGGFIGTHLVRRLKSEGAFVRAVDIAAPAFGASVADEFIRLDLRNPEACLATLDRDFDEVFQLAADMGGAGFVFTGANDREILSNSARINLNVIEACVRRPPGRLFFSSSACIYPRHNQVDDTPTLAEDSAYPADPDSDYGFEKLFGERLYLAAGRNDGLSARIARFHNIYGPEGAWRGGREKAPAALCRKVAEARDGGEIEIWGDGRQQRSFLFADDCIDATLRLTRSDYGEPLNVGSEEMVTIDELAAMIIAISGKRLGIRHVPGPTGVHARRSDNARIDRVLGWQPRVSLAEGIASTYRWVERQVRGD